MEKRPENSELDRSQMEDLRAFLSRRTTEQLKEDLDQTVKDAEADRGPYTSGGTPANVTGAYIAIQEALREKSTKGRK